MVFDKRKSKQRESQSRRIVPYVEDPVTGAIRVPAHIEAKLRVFVNGRPIRTKETLVVALVGAIEAGLIESVARTAREALQKRDQ